MVNYLKFNVKNIVCKILVAIMIFSTFYFPVLCDNSLAEDSLYYYTNLSTIGNYVKRIDKNNDTKDAATTNSYLLFGKRTEEEKYKPLYCTNDDVIEITVNVSRTGFYELYADVQGEQVVTGSEPYPFYFDSVKTSNNNETITIYGDNSTSCIAIDSIDNGGKWDSASLLQQRRISNVAKVYLQEGENTISIGMWSYRNDNVARLYGIKLEYCRYYYTNSKAIKNGTIIRTDINGDTTAFATTDECLIFGKRTEPSEGKPMYCTNDDILRFGFRVEKDGYYKLYADVQGYLVADISPYYYPFYFDSVTVDEKEIIRNNSLDHVCIPSRTNYYGSDFKKQKAEICTVYLTSGSHTFTLGMYSSRNDNVAKMYGVGLERDTDSDISDFKISYENGRNVEWIEPGEVIYASGNIRKYAQNSDYLVAIAFYNDDTLVDVKCERKDLSQLVEKDGNYNFIFGTVPSECNFIKSFIWEYNNLVPASNPYVVSKVKAISKQIYVDSENGYDSNTGELDTPVRTIEKAMQLVSDYKSKGFDGDIIVNIASGEYALDHTLNINNFHADKTGNTILRGYGKTKPIIHGGIKIDNWTDYKNGIKKAIVPENVEIVRSFFVNGITAQRARSKSSYSVQSIKDDSLNFVCNDISNLNSDNANDLELVFDGTWTNQRLKAISLNANLNNLYTLNMLQPYFNYAQSKPHNEVNVSEKKKFYLENALCLIDEPGEYYFDSNTHTLYYYPFSGEDLSNCYVAQVEELLKISGDSIENKLNNFIVENIEFRYCAWNLPGKIGFVNEIGSVYYNEEGNKVDMPSAISVDNAEGVEFKNCVFANMGISALAMNSGVYYSKVDGNVFRDIAGSAVKISMSMEMYPNLSKEMLAKKGLERPQYVTVSNNVVRRVGQDFYCSPAIAVYSAGHINVNNNDIKDIPYSGIFMGFGWDGLKVRDFNSNTIKDNKIENVCAVRSDGSHIYALGTQFNTIISGNYLIKSGDTRGGLYADDDSEGVLITKNVVKMNGGKPGGKWLYLWMNTIKVTAKNNYSDTDLITNAAVNSIVENNTVVTGDNWPPEAKSIMNNAGLKESYKDLLNSNLIEIANERNIQLKSIFN